MTEPLPGSVRILGIEALCEHEGVLVPTSNEKAVKLIGYKSNGVNVACTFDEDDGWYVSASGRGWSIDGPNRGTPEAAVEAFHDLVRKLAEETR